MLRKHLLPLLLSASLVLSLAVSAAAFSDVPTGHWAADSIDVMAAEGIMTGVGEDLFAPDNTLTTAELVTMVVRRFCPDQVVSSQPWPVPYMDAAQKAGLLEGVAAETGAVIGRFDMAQLIYNVLLAQDSGLTSAGESLPSDWDAIPEGYREAVKLCYGAGILKGVDALGTFNGTGVMTRAQAAVVMARVLDLAKDSPEDPDRQSTDLSGDDPSQQDPGSRDPVSSGDDPSQDEGITEAEAVLYIEGLLKENYLGEFDPAYLELVGITEDEARETYEASISASVEDFFYTFDIEYPTDELREETEEMFKEIYSHAKFDVVSAAKQSDSSFSVEVTVAPIDTIQLALADWDEALADFYEKYPYEDQQQMSDEEYEAMDQEYGRIVVDLFKSKLSETGNLAQESVTVQLEKDVDGYFTITLEDFYRIDAKILDYYYA